MTRNDSIRRCLCPCNKELPSRYKGRERIFYSTECRKIWHQLNPGESARPNKKSKEPHYY